MQDNFLNKTSESNNKKQIICPTCGKTGGHVVSCGLWTEALGVKRNFLENAEKIPDDLIFYLTLRVVCPDGHRYDFVIEGDDSDVRYYSDNAKIRNYSQVHPVEGKPLPPDPLEIDVKKPRTKKKEADDKTNTKPTQAKPTEKTVK